ncbi:MAG TPA: oxygen-dependent coproporphyrinogen oxidase [Candidatus Kapabacteria bacterium]|nr:oxygen-dependent coproporphyrinogen oxidase [Candidatus Kapabacteria bacterium]
MALKERAQQYFMQLQDTICKGIAGVDGKAKFEEENWTRAEGGGGRTRILQNGGVFEKAGVNFSEVHGPMPEKLVKAMNVAPADFFATGISLVLHPFSPMVPTVHANFRYFEMSNGDAWFGGGTDLTPYYLYEEDAVHFHKTLRTICDKHSPEYYPKFKKWCDEYFFIKHRGESRGIGGLFFDYQRDDLENFFLFVQDCGNAFLDAYLPIVKKRMNEPFGEREKDFQFIRRGRYVEFNLVYDRGTLFGLETQGRTESILMSLPTLAKWEYNYTPEKGSREEKLVEILKKPKEWV